MSDRAITADLMGRLERHYIKPSDPMPGGIFVPECGINGSTGGGRRCDALYVGFTSASGRQLIGHEVKASRADWRLELAKVGKADTWADQCHAWYVVAPPGVVPVDELPHGWGLLEPDTRKNARRLRKTRRAIVRPEINPGWTVVRSIMARQDTLRSQAIAAGRRAANEDAQQRIAEIRDERSAAALTPETRRRLELLDDLEKHLGVTLDAWAWRPGHVRPDRLAAALKILDGQADLARFEQSAQRLVPDVEHLAGQIGAVLQSLTALNDANQLEETADGRF